MSKRIESLPEGWSDSVSLKYKRVFNQRVLPKTTSRTDMIFMQIRSSNHCLLFSNSTQLTRGSVKKMKTDILIMVKKDISKEYCNFYFLIGYWENWFYSTLLNEKNDTDLLSHGCCHIRTTLLCIQQQFIQVVFIVQPHSVSLLL